MMIHECHIQAYKNAMYDAQHLAKTHDCLYFVYEWPEPGRYQCTSIGNAVETQGKLVGKCYPGGRMQAMALLPQNQNGVRL